MDTTNNRFYREPTFPSTTKTYTAEDGDTMHQGANGMSLRDYFAAKAMRPLTLSMKSAREDEMQSMAREAYAIADAMLRAREKK